MIQTGGKTNEIPPKVLFSQRKKLKVRLQHLIPLRRIIMICQSQKRLLFIHRKLDLILCDKRDFEQVQEVAVGDGRLQPKLVPWRMQTKKKRPKAPARVFLLQLRGVDISTQKLHQVKNGELDRQLGLEQGVVDDAIDGPGLLHCPIQVMDKILMNRPTGLLRLDQDKEHQDQEHQDQRVQAPRNSHQDGGGEEDESEGHVRPETQPTNWMTSCLLFDTKLQEYHMLSQYIKR